MVNRRYCYKQYQQYPPISNNVYFSLIHNRRYVSLINIKCDILTLPIKLVHISRMYQACYKYNQFLTP